ncbi:MAG: hypothetical protein MJ110_01915 [Lachnospiraceae bacterium]|nr:hypothetical protein [Lachnospiraceae bacterium]
MMSAEWSMVIITAIYVIATIIICFSNYKSSKMSQRANEINLVLSILDTEKNRLFEIKNALNEFERNATLLHQVVCKKKDNIEQYVMIQDSYISLTRNFMLENNVNSKEYKKIIHCTQCLCNFAVEMIKWLKEEYREEDEKVFFEKIERGRDIQQEFSVAKENYILYRERKLSAYYKSTNLEEIQQYYCNVDFRRRFECN